ncbi:putative immunity protein [Arthrobacter sp. TmT3-37]
MILPAVRDVRLVSVRRGGTLTEIDHQLLALWAATCAEHVLALFEESNRGDSRPRDAIEAARAERDWQRRQIPEHLRALVLEDQVRRTSICWSVFDD